MVVAECFDLGPTGSKMAIRPQQDQVRHVGVRQIPISQVLLQEVSSQVQEKEGRSSNRVYFFGNLKGTIMWLKGGEWVDLEQFGSAEPLGSRVKSDVSLQHSDVPKH
ncbi:hypothetical protein Tco_0644426 [Tanacetum coccineum]